MSLSFPATAAAVLHVVVGPTASVVCIPLHIFFGQLLFASRAGKNQLRKIMCCMTDDGKNYAHFIQMNPFF